MKNSENADRAASAIAMLSGRHCRPSGKDAHARRNPPNNSSSTRILQVHHSLLQNGVTKLVPTVRTAVPESWPLRARSKTIRAAFAVHRAGSGFRGSESQRAVGGVGQRAADRGCRGIRRGTAGAASGCARRSCRQRSPADVRFVERGVARCSTWSGRARRPSTTVVYLDFG